MKKIANSLVITTLCLPVSVLGITTAPPHTTENNPSGLCDVIDLPVLCSWWRN